MDSGAPHNKGKKRGESKREGKIRLREPLDCSIRVTKTTREKLKKRKIIKEEYYDEVINRLLGLLDQLDPNRDHMRKWVVQEHMKRLGNQPRKTKRSDCV